MQLRMLSCCFPLPAQFGAEAFILHYTYGQDLSEAGAFTPGARGFWHWDKREYEQVYPPRNISLPLQCQVRTLPTPALLVSTMGLTRSHLSAWPSAAAHAVETQSGLIPYHVVALFTWQGWYKSSTESVTTLQWVTYASALTGCRVPPSRRLSPPSMMPAQLPSHGRTSRASGHEGGLRKQSHHHGDMRLLYCGRSHRRCFHSQLSTDSVVSGHRSKQQQIGHAEC